MKKKLFTLMLALVAIATTARAQVTINATNFPDEKFRNWLLQQDYGKDGKLTTTEIAAVKEIDVSDKGISISNLKGIEYFTALTVLKCNWNNLTSLDVSKNTALTELRCSRNQLTKLDVSKNTALTELYCNFNQLTALDVSKNTKLTRLECINNKLTALDVSGCTNLQSFHCDNNQIKGDKMLALVNSLPKVSNGYFCVIDTKNSNEQNVITKSQVAIAKGKNWIVYDNNNDSPVEYAGSDPTGIAINSTNFPDANFRSYVSGTTIDKDKDRYLSDEEIAAVTKIDVSGKSIKNLKGIEYFTALTTLYCKNNQLTSLDVSKNTKLTTLSCYSNQIKGDNMQALVNSLPTVTSGKFWAVDTKDSNEGNAITKSQVANARSKGWKVYDYNGGSGNLYNGAIGIDATNFPDANFRNWVLAQSYGKDGVLTSEEIAAVTKIDVGKKSIKNLKGIEFFTALTELFCNDNELGALDMSVNTKLTSLNCARNGMASLNVSANTKLEKLYCLENQLGSLDVSKNTKLTTLSCGANKLTELNVSKNLALTMLSCHSNQIKGDKMVALQNSLPKVSSGKGNFYVINTKNSSEQNVITKSQVTIAKSKNWKVLDYNGGGASIEYEGSDDLIAINETNFPDEKFRSFVSSNYDTDKNGYLSTT